MKAFDTRARYGHNCNQVVLSNCFSKITYLAHAKGYVMARRPGYTPFVITEKQWLAFEIFTDQQPEIRAYKR